MLTAEMNERLTRVGPGTPCGELMRRYSIPIAPSAQLLDNPVRPVRILGEDLVLYKTTKGELGLVGRRCLHRLVDLQYGIPDEGGLRCPYHGWHYDTTGECIERPMEAAPHAKFPRKLPAYPVRELGGMIFAYMGPAPAPDLPRWDLFVWPNAIRQIAVNVLNCNWLQCQENTGDPTHSVWAHGHFFKYVLEREGRFEERAASEKHTLRNRIKWGNGIKEITAARTQYGFEKGIVYSKELGAEEDHVHRHATVMFPFYTNTGSPGAPRSEYQIRVPIDDTHTLHFCYQVYAAPPGVTAPAQNTVPWYEPPTHDANGKPIFDYVLAQDAFVWWAQGDLVDRTQESLGRTDIPIILLRRQLDEQISLVEQGERPMNVFDTSPDILFGAGVPPQSWTGNPATYQPPVVGQDYRRMYHKGFAIDDADRYGPMIEQVKDLHRTIEEAGLKAQAQARRVDGQLVISE